MEFSNVEVKVIEFALKAADPGIGEELTQLELVMVGGGIGETVL